MTAAQQHCAATVDMLRRTNDTDLDATQLQRKQEIIHRVLAEDAEVRSLAEPWMAELDRLLRGFRLQRDVGRAYR